MRTCADGFTGTLAQLQDPLWPVHRRAALDCDGERYAIGSGAAPIR